MNVVSEPEKYITEEDKAEIRSANWLYAHLSETQRATWVRHQYFDVATPRGSVWRIVKSRISNLVVVAVGESPLPPHAFFEGRRVCVVMSAPYSGVPVSDLWLAQKLLLESEGGEETVLRIGL